MTTTLPILGDAGELWETSYSGFNYPQTVEMIRLLGDGTSTRNAVMQQGALPHREARLSGNAPESQLDDIRALYESREETSFTDRFGNVRSVRILDFTSELILGDLSGYTLTLLETSDPVPPGS